METNVRLLMSLSSPIVACNNTKKKYQQLFLLTCQLEHVEYNRLKSSNSVYTTYTNDVVSVPNKLDS
ncbi:hypothetical protein Hanom_Chr13g01227781 [Helianthus anomalus]